MVVTWNPRHTASIHFQLSKSDTVKSLSRVRLCDPMDCSLPGFSIHGVFQARITGVGCHFLLQGIFLTQGLNPRVLHWQAGSLPLSHPGSPELSSPTLKLPPF